MKRVIYKIVGVNGEGKPKLVYIGQTTNFERRMSEHREKLTSVLARVGGGSTYRKYIRLRKHFKAGRVYFEKIDEGDWTWEEALLRETEIINEYRRRYRHMAVLNEVDSPHDGKMPDGKLVWDPSRNRHLIRVFAGLMPGGEAVVKNSKTEREIVKVTERVGDPDRGIETWEFARSGETWTAGKMPKSIAMRVYRGRLLQLYKKSRRALMQHERTHAGDGIFAKLPPMKGNKVDISKCDLLARRESLAEPAARWKPRFFQPYETRGGQEVKPEKKKRYKKKNVRVKLKDPGQSKAVFGRLPEDAPLAKADQDYEISIKRDGKGRRIVGVSYA